MANIITSDISPRISKLSPLIMRPGQQRNTIANRLWRSLLDITPPILSGLSPAAASTLPSSSTPLSFAIAGATTVFIIATYEGGVTEVPYDSASGFSALYSSSTRTVSAGTWTFSIRRSAGWLKNPTLRIYATDAAGNPLDVTRSWLFTPAPTPLVSQPTVKFVNQLAPNQLDFGNDIMVFPDLDPSMSLVADGRVVAQTFAKNITTPRGSLSFHPDRCIDIRDFLNEQVTRETLFRIKAACEAEAEADERVNSANVTVSFIRETGVLRLGVALELTEGGPFSFTTLISQDLVQLLNSET